MRASVIEQGVFITTDQGIPNPSSGQVLVKNLACGICGSDLDLYKMLQSMPDAPATILGHAFCAEIVSFGPNTNQTLSIGQKVCSVPFLKNHPANSPIGVSPEQSGAYSEYMVLSEEYLLPIPEGTPIEAAALTEPFAVAIHPVEKANLRTDDIPLVMGTGPIGLATIAVLKQRGIKHIVASDYSASRRALATQMGASEGLHPGETDVLGHYAELANEPYHSVIFECVGTVPLFGQICELAPKHTRIIMAGLCTSEVTFNPFNPFNPFRP